MTAMDFEPIAASSIEPSSHDFLESGFIESFDRRYPTHILETLLCDRTTGRNIIWADNEYEALGEGYMGDDEITVEKITGTNSGVIKPRIAKEQERQSQRTKSRAEVFTHYSWDRLLGACPYSFLDEEMYVWEALWATRPAARARPFCPASSEGPGGVAGAGGMSA